MSAKEIPELVEKERVGFLLFLDSITVEQHPELKSQIENATVLGNTHKRKVEIVFRDDNGLKKVQTTIWSAGSKFICLKGGVWIPIDRIVEIVI